MKNTALKIIINNKTRILFFGACILFLTVSVYSGIAFKNASLDSTISRLTQEKETLINLYENKKKEDAISCQNKIDEKQVELNDIVEAKDKEINNLKLENDAKNNKLNKVLEILDVPNYQAEIENLKKEISELKK